MIPFSEIVFTAGGVLLRIFALMLLPGYIYCLISAFSRQKALGYKAVATILVLLAACWFCLLLDGSFYVAYFDRVRVYPAPVERLFGAPWIVVLAFDLLFAVLLGLALYDDFRLSRRQLSFGAVKETMDVLPVAVCFGSEDGAVMLRNLEANRLSYELTGKPLYNVYEFWRAIEERSERQDNARIVVFPDGQAVLFRRDEIMTDGAPYLQITGGDVTMNDGLFEVTLIRMPDNIIDWPTIINALATGAEHEKVISFKTSRLTIECDEELPWTTDGEYGGSYTKVVVRNIHKALPIILGEAPQVLLEGQEE